MPEIKFLPRRCLFCDQTIAKGSSKAKEHVLKKSWLRELGHYSSPLWLESWAPGEQMGLRHVETRKHSAGQLLTGDVCKACNGGWMKHLDESVSETVLALATRRRMPRDLDKEECKQLARGVLKTLYAFEYTDTPERRHNAKKMGYKMDDPQVAGAHTGRATTKGYIKSDEVRVSVVQLALPDDSNLKTIRATHKNEKANII